MGTRAPEDDRRYFHGDSPDPHEPSPVDGGEPQASVHTSRDADGRFREVGGGDDDDDGDGDGDGESEGGEVSLASPVTNAAETAPKKSKRRRPNKKKSKKKKSAAKATPEQSSPPRIPLTQLFPSGEYPEGEIQPYQHEPALTTARTTTAAAEHRSTARQHLWDDPAFLRTYRRAAEVHRQTRRWIQDAGARPGVTLHALAQGIEDSVRALLDNAGLAPGDGLRSGLGFPTGLCVNHQVAHYTPNPGQQEVVLQGSDVLTVDFGVHVDGWIVDSAFTMVFEEASPYARLLEAVREATNVGVRTAGVDVRISDVSAAIQEVMESHEVELPGGKTVPVRAVRNLSGHNIGRYRIHGGKSIPFVKHSDQTKMEEGEVFAIETFGTTGRGYVVDDVGVYGYGLHHDAPLRAPLPLSSATRLHKTIRDNFGTLVFCRRYLERLGVEKYLAGMNCLVSNGIVEEYKPMRDVKGSCSAQFEHTFLLRETHKEVLSRGDDY